jgi:hypothetical protein
MCSRILISIAVIWGANVIPGCGHSSSSGAAMAAVLSGTQSVIDTALPPGVNPNLGTTDPRHGLL